MGEDLVRSLVLSLAQGVRLVLAEGVMGLFDGVAAPGQWGRGSTADIASLTGWPVVLVMDVSGQGETAAAVALGCASYRRDVRIVGVILNRVASARQEALIVPAVERAGFPVLGCIGRNDDLTLPERHLGLVQASETDDLEARLDAIADAVEAGVRIFDLVALAAPAFRSADNAAISARPAIDPPGQRIALAQDRAFCVHVSSHHFWLACAGRGDRRLLAARGRTPRSSMPTQSGCRAGIRSCTGARSPPPAGSATA